jgi:hypothetical protein
MKETIKEKSSGMKKSKRFVASHTSQSQRGVGDYYGTGIRNKVGIVRDSFSDLPLPLKKGNKPPKSLA